MQEISTIIARIIIDIGLIICNRSILLRRRKNRHYVENFGIC